MRFDHLMHWVLDLEAGIARCTELGFAPQRLSRIGEHLHNSGWWGREPEYLKLTSVVEAVVADVRRRSVVVRDPEPGSIR